MKKVDIYTDGSCSYNPGKGGWCAILIYKGVEKIISGNDLMTTNNRMELLAVIQGLKELKESCNVTIYSDSAYVVNAINQGWIYQWQLNGWKRGKEELKNQDLWQDLADEIKKHSVTFVKVKGHSDNEYNNKCDKIARQETMSIS